MLCGLASVFLALGVRALAEQPPTFELVEGDSVVFIGNTFAEQMHLFGYFETFLHGKRSLGSATLAVLPQRRCPTRHRSTAWTMARMPALTDSGRSGQASSSGQSLTTSARQGTQILHPEVVKLLEEWLATKPDLAPNTLLFPVSGPIPGGKERKTHKMMKRDLEGARKTWIEEVKAIEEQARRKATDFLKYCNADGLFADFHSNRHLFITSLERAGLSPKMAQSLARHSDIRLTLDVYTHVELHDQTAAINSLPAPPGNDVGQPNEAAALAATGTDGPDVPASTCDKTAQQVDAFSKALIASESRQLDSLLDFAARAYRRPLTEVETERLRSLYSKLRAQDTPHDESFRLTLARIFASPEFLYRLEERKPVGQSETDDVPARPAAHSVSDLELANRLSYFLWSSLPDEQLREAADQGRLTGADGELPRQSRRMLQDPRVRRLAIQFACQWLHIRDFDQLQEKSSTQFPEFAALQKEMYEESIRFFVDLFQNEGSILDILQADHTFLNERLAAHYGIPEVHGSGWQRVDGVGRFSRGGILTQADPGQAGGGLAHESDSARQFCL